MLPTMSSNRIITLLTILSILPQVFTAENVWYPKNYNDAPPKTDTTSNPHKYTLEELSEDFLVENMLCHNPNQKTLLKDCMFYTADMSENAMDFVCENCKLALDYKHTIWVCVEPDSPNPE
jgi:hypothetical protein